MNRTNSTIEAARHELVDTALVTFAFAGLVVIPVLLLRVLELGWHPTMLSSSLAGAITITIAIYRDKLSFDLKAAGMIILIFLAGAVYIGYEYIAEGLGLLILAAVLTAIFYGSRPSIVLVVMGSLLIGAKGLLISLGLASTSFDYAAYSHSIYTWISISTAIIFFGIIMIQTQVRLLNMLESAIHEVSTIRGLLPICSNCKRIRDDSGYWHQVELFIGAHSDAEFTHSICERCTGELYADIDLTAAIE